MKKVMAILALGLLTSAAQAASDDCIAAVTQALSLAPGQKIELLNGKTPQGLACELRVGFSKANSGITNEDYRSIDITPFSVKRYSNGTLSNMYADLFMNLEDNSQGLNVYKVKTCNVTAEGMLLKYSSSEVNGWHRTKYYEINMTLENGKIKSVNASSSVGESSECQF